MKKIVLLVLVIGLFAITCPDREDHITTIKNGLTRVAEARLGFFGTLLMPLAVDYILEHEIVTHNYLLFSTASIAKEGRERTISFGVLGNVYFDEESIAASLDRALEKEDADVNENKPDND